MDVIEVGTRVRAVTQIVEGIGTPDPDADQYDPGWVYAEPGDEGEVVEITPATRADGTVEPETAAIVVMFDRTQTSTMTFAQELEVVSGKPEEDTD